MRNRNTTPNPVIKKALNDAFRIFRTSYKFLAKQSFLCCQSCAWAEAGHITDQNPGKYAGIVFYHKQDAENLRDRKDPGCYIAFGVADEKQTAPTCKEIGDTVVRVLRKQGLEVVWDGNENTRIWVGLPKPFVGEGI